MFLFFDEGGGMYDHVPPLMSLVSKYGGWDNVLWLGATAFVVCGVAGMLTNANEPLFRTEEAPA